MAKYRKKPVLVEAFQMTLERRMDNSEWPAWLGQAWNNDRDSKGALQRVNMDAPLPDQLEIVTLEGKHLVSWGDYIIQGVQGELYPCKPDIFKQTYEKAEEELTAERDEALNQLDSARHSVDVLERRLTDKLTKLAKAVEALEVTLDCIGALSNPQELYGHGLQENEIKWIFATLAELKGKADE